MTIFSDAYLPYPYGPVPSPGTPSPKFVDLLNNQTVAGDKTFTDSLILSKAAQSGLAEINMQISVSDDPNASIVLANQQSTNGRYVPHWIYRGTGAGSTLPVLQNLFRCGPSMDVGSSSMVDHVFQGAPSTNVSNRTLYRILNNATALQTMSWFGGVTNTVLAQAGGAETLATWGVSDTGSAGFNFLNGTTGDGAFLPRFLLRPTSGFGAFVDGYGAADTPGLVQLQLKGSVLGVATSNSIPIGFYNAGRLDATMEAGGSFALRQPGQGFRIAEGANCKQGVATLVAGTVTVPNTSVTANSRIHATGQDNNVTGTVRISTRTPGVSFTLTSTNAADSGVVAYTIFEPS